MSEFNHVVAETAEPWIEVPGDWRRPDAPERFTVHWDRTRSYGQVLPRPTAADVPRFYDIDEYYTHHAPDLHSGVGRGFFDRALVHLAWRADRGVESDEAWWTALGGATPATVLEIGCGNGFNLSFLKKHGHTVTGVEPDPAALEEARHAGLEVYAGTGEDLPDEIRRRKFDIIVFMHVLEHTLDPAAAVRNAQDLLAEGGRIVAEVPNNACLAIHHFGPTWYWLDIPRHLNFFSRDSLVALLESAGCRVENLDYRGYVRQFDPDWIAVQTRIAKTFGTTPVGMAGYWRYLLATAWRDPQKKYDSVRVIARAS